MSYADAELSIWVHHHDLTSRDRRTWKPMRKRILALSRRLIPDCECLPGRGCTSFDGTRFRHSFGGMGFRFKNEDEMIFVLSRLNKIPYINIIIGVMDPFAANRRREKRAIEREDGK